MKQKFTEDDKKKFIDFLNFVAKKAEFNGMTTADIIEYFKLLSHMQQHILPKIESNIFEIIETKENNNPPAVPERE